MVKEKYFKICKNNIEIEGYVDITTIDDDEPVIEYRDPATGLYGQYPVNRFKDNEEDFYDFESLQEAHYQDVLFLEKVYRCEEEELIVKY